LPDKSTFLYTQAASRHETIVVGKRLWQENDGDSKMPWKQFRTSYAAVVLATVLSMAIMPLRAQQEDAPPPPPPDSQGSQAPPSPDPSPAKQLARLAKRYGLSASQRSAIQPVLQNQAEKLNTLFANSSLTPREQFLQADAIHQETSEKIEAVLDDGQRAKYETDEAKQAARKKQFNQNDMGDGPPGPPL
jgi:hypothetical protein